MIDRHSRAKAIAAIRDFLDCRTTNDDFEWEYPGKSDDRAILAIENVMWLFYSDHKVSKFVGPLLPNAQSLVERILLFLPSDLEYEYKEVNFFKPKNTTVDPLGEDSIWPFFRQQDLELVKKNA